MTQRFTWRGPVISATLSAALLAGCPSSTPSAVTPTAKPSGTASTAPSGTPTAAPTGTPTSGSDVPGATPTPSGLPSTPDTSSRATIQGVVVDDKGVRLDGVTVTGKVLGAGTFSNGSDTLTVTTQVGSYALNGAPTGSTILITASKVGLTRRQRTIVPLSNLQGSTDINNVSFGGTSDPAYAFSDAPEVVSFTPAKDATGVDANTAFTLTFSEPVNTQDVENAFAIYVAGPITTPGTLSDTDSYMLTALTDDGNPAKLLYTYDSKRDDGAVANTATVVRNSAMPIYDSRSFSAAWSNNNQTVTFTPRPGVRLPTDKDSSKLPQYAVSFKDGAIRDAAGTGRSDSWFRVSPAQVGRAGYRFTVAADTGAPVVSAITGLSGGDVAGGNTNRIRVQFNEPMHLFPANYGGKAIPGIGAPMSAARAGNFNYALKETLVGGVADADLVATTSQAGVSFLTDPTRSTVEFSIRNDDPLAAGTGFTIGNLIWVKAGAAITDPAGNPVTTSNNLHLRSGRVI
ncbi:MAG: Ig-like domain-containing protein [Candidatus Sericytochromatia bacterium]|nr:Ig-like domain-containing protein [Candidatus Sericytochromatia bacterium]